MSRWCFFLRRKLSGRELSLCWSCLGGNLPVTDVSTSLLLFLDMFYSLFQRMVLSVRAKNFFWSCLICCTNPIFMLLYLERAAPLQRRIPKFLQEELSHIILLCGSTWILHPNEQIQPLLQRTFEFVN